MLRNTGFHVRAFDFIRVALTALVLVFVPFALFPQLTPPANSPNPQIQKAPQPIGSAPLAAVSGHIFRADTGAPLAKAIVIIQKIGVYPTDRQVRRTGAAGAYVFEDLDPGTYQLSASAVGFAPAAYAQGQTMAIAAPNEESVHVAAGQAISRIDLSLSTCAAARCQIYSQEDSLRPVPTNGWVISGTMVDPNGEPLDGRVETIGERHIPRSTPEYATTDAQGRFQIAGAETDNIRLEATAVGLEGSGYVTMYYPGALSEEGAQIFRVTPGAAFRNLRVVFKKVPVYTVSGKVSDGGGAQRYLVGISGGLTFLPGRNTAIRN